MEKDGNGKPGSTLSWTGFFLKIDASNQKVANEWRKRMKL
jgi:hypothetical protein